MYIFTIYLRERWITKWFEFREGKITKRKIDLECFDLNYVAMNFNQNRLNYLIYKNSIKKG